VKYVRWGLTPPMHSESGQPLLPAHQVPPERRTQSWSLWAGSIGCVHRSVGFQGPEGGLGCHFHRAFMNRDAPFNPIRVPAPSGPSPAFHKPAGQVSPKLLLPPGSPADSPQRVSRLTRRRVVLQIPRQPASRRFLPIKSRYAPLEPQYPSAGHSPSDTSVGVVLGLVGEIDSLARHAHV
jgi:hypothetical protein